MLLCIFEDFNDILSAQEKKSIAIRPNRLIRGFRQAIQEFCLVDIHMEGCPFIWFKSMGTSRVVEEKLDRALVIDVRMQLFPHVRLETLVASSSYHFPILLDITLVLHLHWAKKKKKHGE